jgi:hypothetical protein
MENIINYLDDFLIKTGRIEIDAVEANAILAKAGILKDNNERAGKPLRELLRKGKLPHAYQANGRNWKIPHSSKVNNRNISPIKIEKIKLVKKSIENLNIDTTLLSKMLMDEKNYKSASLIDNLVPHSAGIYCVQIIDIHKLPIPFNSLLKDRNHNIIYIGIATKSLKKRFLNQELRGNGHGTFFRSIGAILGYRPIIGSLVDKINKRNFKFSTNDEKEIIKWINQNLKVNWIQMKNDFENLETQLINTHKPLLNLAKNPLALKSLSDLRKECVRIANEIK